MRISVIKSAVRFLPKLAVLFTVCITVNTKLLAQKITINDHNVPLKKIFDQITKQGGYIFFYDQGLIDTIKNVTVSVKNADVKDVLNICVKDRALTYIISGNTIGIKKISVPNQSPQISPQQKIIPETPKIRGRVMEKTGNSLIGVNIANMNPARRDATESELNGMFEVEGKAGDLLIFTAVGFKKIELKYKGDAFLKIVMETDISALDAVTVGFADLSQKKIPWTDTINLTRRTHMNLGQVLQGSIPGLTMQNSSQSQKVVTSIIETQNFNAVVSVQDMRARYEEYADIYRSEYGVNDFDAFLNFYTSDPTSPWKLNYTTTVNNKGLIPQLRGVSGFNGNTSGMLIVIDGFPQDGFPADYPMTNVESIKVIKDPEELTKWGPRATGGVILITSKRNTGGKLKIGYNSNIYYSRAPKFNREKLMLGTSHDVLDYLKSSYDSGFMTVSDYFQWNLTPPELLLQNLKTGRITQDVFNEKWDSLGLLSNESQLGMLQQDVFNQNHVLTLSGGTHQWRFRAAGSYGTSRTTALGNLDRNVGLNLMNNFSLLKNKLTAQWQVVIERSNKRAGTTTELRTIQPYQLLTDSRGTYVYDYSTFNPTVNKIIEDAGYENYGINALEDARLNNTVSKLFRVQSRLNIDWNILPALKWSSSFQGALANVNRETFADARSSQARQTIDDYASPIFNDESDPNRYVTGIDYFVPKGGIYSKSTSKNKDWNLRSALMFDKNLGKHHIAMTIGGGGSSNTLNTPAYYIVYGYNPQSGKGQPVELPSPDPKSGIRNFRAVPMPVELQSSTIDQLIYPYPLTAPKAGSDIISRSLNWNGEARYTFDNTIMLGAKYNSVLTPSFGYDPPYTTLTTYSASAGWRISNKPFFNLPTWINELVLSTGVDGVEIPNLPTQISASRIFQSNWNNYGLWVNNYNTAQQNGQNVRNVYEKLSIGLADGRYKFDISYNTQNTQNINEKTASVKKGYIGTNARINLRRGLLFFAGGYGLSPEGKAQTNMKAAYNIAKESYFRSATISSLSADFALQNISSFQGISLMAETNAPNSGGGYSMAINNNFGILPPSIKNLEGHFSIGFFQEKLLLDLRYYNKTTSGLGNNVPLRTDPSTGLNTQYTYSEINNKGVEMYLRAKAVDQQKISYTITLNGAYNVNIANSVPATAFSATGNYLTAYRNGYSTENMWSYRWGGLDATGSPQIYNTQNQKITNPDSLTLASSLIYSGVTRAPYTAGFINELNIQDFFFRTTFLINMGHVMRQYIPSPSGFLDNNLLTSSRWRKPGDEAYTEIAAMSAVGGPGTNRAFIIQNSSNSILPADNIRWQEAQIGWSASDRLLKNFSIEQLTLSFQMQNIAVWKRNKLHVDPETLSSGGQIFLVKYPQQYSFSINMNF